MLFLCVFPDVKWKFINYRLVNIFRLVSYRIERVDNLCYSDSVSQELGFLKDNHDTDRKDQGPVEWRKL